MPHELHAMTEMAPPRTNKDLHSSLGIMNYLSQFSPAAVEICKSLCNLISVKMGQPWNKSYQDMFERAKDSAKRIHA